MGDCRIEDFALIGDCETAALVGRDGSIDWLCWPRFDSDACFAAILGTPEHGNWSVAPAGEVTGTSRRYRDGTLVLETTFETATGTVRLTDFMPPRGRASDVVRLVEGIRGTVSMRMKLFLRFGYGRVTPWVSRLPDGSLRAIAGPDMVVLRSSVETHGENMHTVAEFELGAGERASFVLTYGASHEPLPEAIDPEAALADTVAFWSEWSGRYHPVPVAGGPPLPATWTEAMRRSMVILKALTYRPTGGIVAAPTTSLPEQLGSSRNWDYRFCWLRDSAVTLFAFLDGGYLEEAQAWRDWLVRAMAGSVDDMQIMFGLAGERRLVEWEVDWLPGFRGSRPVRVGNAAHGQRQLDVFGEVMTLLHQARLGGIPESEDAWALQRNMLARLEEIWREPDEGIWEVRGESRHFVFSKVMAWVAFDRCIASSERFGLEAASIDRWRELREEIHRDVCRHGFDEGRNTFVQSYGSPDLDGSLLLLPILGFLPADDPRIRGTVEAVERELMVDGFVLRYRTSETVDGLPEGEGAFLACSFWLVSAYAALGRLEDAERLFERLLAIRNDVGLLAEEYDPASRRQLGNFPQAFSHVALVNAGHRLARARAGRPHS